MLEVFCLTWNVNEARPEGGNALHRWVVDLSREAGLLVVALQEIESGGSSLAMAAAKDALLARQQVTPHESWHIPGLQALVPELPPTGHELL